MNEMLRRRGMIAKKDPRIKALIHFDGTIKDERGHAVTTNNTYNTMYTDGIFGQCLTNIPDMGSGFNLKCDLGLQEMPAKWTVACWSQLPSIGMTAVPQFGILSDSAWARYGSSALVLNITAYGGNKFRLSGDGSWANSYDVIGSSLCYETVVWRHYAVTYDNGIIRWYFNGNKVCETTIQAPTGNNGSKIGFGNFKLTDEFVFADDLLIEGDTYEIPQEPYK